MTYPVPTCVLPGGVVVVVVPENTCAEQLQKEVISANTCAPLRRPCAAAVSVWGREGRV